MRAHVITENMLVVPIRVEWGTRSTDVYAVVIVFTDHHGRQWAKPVNTPFYTRE